MKGWWDIQGKNFPISLKKMTRGVCRTSDTSVIEKRITVFKGMFLRVEIIKVMGKSRGISILFERWAELRKVRHQPKLHQPKGATRIAGEVRRDIIIEASGQETPNNRGQDNRLAFSKSQGQSLVIVTDELQKMNLFNQ